MNDADKLEKELATALEQFKHALALFISAKRKLDKAMEKIEQAGKELGVKR